MSLNEGIGLYEPQFFKKETAKVLISFCVFF